ncbi:SMODS domain-containing nucleotidyltransferase [Gracilimonas sediminicola]|uniref:SMODS domain-containing nucleotidyltransferase n=1 Tax=Gracilimonas sediminicola TaxID=2952158 RepID=UPI0038D42A58
MTINSYLTSIANQAIVRDDEKQNIKRSISTLSDRLNKYFGSEITNHFQFGSSSRDTMMPRKMDGNSDVDYMIVFKDDSYRPQTYLDKLRRFADMKYSRSEIKQSHPTIILSLSHIHFELVPALSSFWRAAEYRIPDKASSYDDWVRTSPLVLETNLVTSNKENNYLIKPLIRLMKYWNAVNNYPFRSYDLEEKILKNFDVNPFMFQYSSNEKLEDYFYEFVIGITNSWSDPDWKRKKFGRLKDRVDVIKRLKKKGHENDAVDILKNIFPPLN